MRWWRLDGNVFEEGDVEACARDVARRVVGVAGGEGAALRGDEGAGERKADADARGIDWAGGCAGRFAGGDLRRIGALAVAGARATVEALEDMGQIGLGDTGPGVGDVDAAGDEILVRAHGDRAARGRCLEAVLEDVAECLGRPSDIAGEAAAIVDMGDQRDIGEVVCDGERTRRTIDELAHLNRRMGKGEGTGIKTGKAQQLGHELLHVHLELLDAPQAVHLGRAVAPPYEVLAHELGSERQRGERRLELMRDVGECVGKLLALAGEVIGREGEAQHHLVELAGKDGEFAFVHALERQLALAVEHGVEAFGQTGEVVVAPIGMGEEGDAAKQRRAANNKRHARRKQRGSEGRKRGGDDEPGAHGARERTVSQQHGAIQAPCSPGRARW